jgi:putative aldouronate transport system substrate-binding protein
MKKRIFALLLALTMVVSMAALVGCQPVASSGAATSAPAGATSAPAVSTAPETKAPAGDAVTLVWLMGDPGKVPVDESIVEDALNKISMEKLNCKMKTVYYDDKKIQLALSTGEAFDMSFTCEWFNNFAVQAKAGYFADITDKLKTVTPNLYSTMPDIVWEGAKIDGKILAIPVKKDYAAEMYYRFDKALFVDELKKTIPATMKFEDIEQYLKAAKDAFTAGTKAAENAEFPLKLTKGGFPGVDSNFDMINRDVLLGIPYSAVGGANESKVLVTVESPDVYDRLVLLNKWYKAGYINPDAATLDDAGKYSATKVGQGFYGADAIWSGGDGYTQLISKFSGPYLSTSSIRGSMNAIAASSKNIDLALKYQELVNTDLAYRDTLRYGIEGTHWNRTAEGLIQKTQQGRDNYGPWAFSQGSYSLSTPEAAEGVKVDPNMWKVIFDGYKDAVATKTIGFSFDITSVEAEVAACKAAKDKYWNSLATGTLDPATTVPTMIKEMEAAGLRKIQTECQKQFDTWLAAQK